MSVGFSAVVHVVVEAHVVDRAVPPIRITEAVLPLPAEKLLPVTDSGIDCTTPAITLAGSSVSITGPLVSAMVAVADFVGSAWLVALSDIAFGDGAKFGAVKIPEFVTDPHAVPPHPAPATPLCTLQVTAWFAEPTTRAENCCVLKFPAGRNAYCGEIEMETFPFAATTVINALALRVLSASLTAVSTIGCAPGTCDGAT
jgi:hypothetical protein